MLRQAAKRLMGAGFRNLTTSAARFEEAAAPAGPKEFVEKWSKVAPSTMALPELPTNFIKSGSTGESLAQGDLFPVNFYTPHGVIADSKQVGSSDGKSELHQDEAPSPVYMLLRSPLCASVAYSICILTACVAIQHFAEGLGDPARY